MSMTDDLIVFVHVPKTAGSSVNAALRKQYPTGIEHCEHIVSDMWKLTDAAASAHWISGHVPFHILRGRLSQVTDRKLRFFSVMRRPVDQVRSHYNWLIEIHHRGGRFYRNHPPQIRALSERIRQSDHTDPNAVVKNLQAAPGLFLNTQANMILGQRFDWNSGKFLQHLRHYEFVATERDIPQLFERLGIPEPEQQERHNVSGYHFDPDVFDQPIIENFLMRNNFKDWILYQTLRANPVRRAISASFRRNRKVADVPGVQGLAERARHLVSRREMSK